MGIAGLILKTLLPDDLAFDMAMNIFTFPPGFALPVIETHVMEHGLYFLEGQGLYYLGDTWSEVKRGDFIWMGPYVPQSFYATSSVPSRYLYYKDVTTTSCSRRCLRTRLLLAQALLAATYRGYDSLVLHAAPRVPRHRLAPAARQSFPGVAASHLTKSDQPEARAPGCHRHKAESRAA
jgi:quercetin dioxygenase-like cupin family protein